MRHIIVRGHNQNKCQAPETCTQITCMYNSILLWIRSSHIFRRLSELQFFGLDWHVLVFRCRRRLEDRKQWQRVWTKRSCTCKELSPHQVRCAGLLDTLLIPTTERPLLFNHVGFWIITKGLQGALYGLACVGRQGVLSGKTLIIAHASTCVQWLGTRGRTLERFRRCEEHLHASKWHWHWEISKRPCPWLWALHKATKYHQLWLKGTWAC